MTSSVKRPKQKYFVLNTRKPADGTYNLADLALAIEEASSFGQVRIPKSRVRGPLVFNLPSHKARLKAEQYKTLILEGRPEGYAALLHEFDPSVECYKPQPFTLRFHDGVRLREKTPDLLIFYRDKPPALAEVKPVAHLADPDTAAAMQAMSKACREYGFGFHVFTAEYVTQQPRLDNLILLYPFASAGIAPHLPSLLQILDNANRPLPLQSIQALDPAIGAAEIAVGLSQGLIRTSHQIAWGPLFNVARV